MDKIKHKKYSFRADIEDGDYLQNYLFKKGFDNFNNLENVITVNGYGENKKADMVLYDLIENYTEICLDNEFFHIGFFTNDNDVMFANINSATYVVIDLSVHYDDYSIDVIFNLIKINRDEVKDMTLSSAKEILKEAK